MSNRAQYIRELREQLSEFRDQHAAARRDFNLKGLFVPARLLGMTGITLGELSRFGMIDEHKGGYAPAQERELAARRGRFSARKKR